MNQPEADNVVQIIPAVPMTFGVIRQADSSILITRVSLWALVEFEDEKEGRCIYGGFACDLGVGFFEEESGFLGYADSKESAEALYCK